MTMKSKMKRLIATAGMRKVGLFMVVVLVCGGVSLLVLSREPEQQVTVKEQVLLQGMPVSVEQVAPASYPAEISALGEARPEWDCLLKAQVGGTVDDISATLRVGCIVSNGEWLVSLENSAYEQQVAEAESQVATAEVVLLREQQEADEAHMNWKRSGMQGDPDSALVLRGPQLREAQAQLHSAEKGQIRAEQLLNYTKICAPFNGLVVERMVSRGNTLFEGDAVARLYGVDQLEIAVQLDAHQWAMLPDNLQGTAVDVCDVEQAAHWTTSVARAGGHLSSESRLRTLFLRIEHPLEQDPPLLPGTFVRASIVGRELPDLLRIPEAALTKRGEVWFVDAEDCLNVFHADPVFYQEGVVFVRAPEGCAEMQIATRPNSSFAAGLQVQPRSAQPKGL